MDFVSAVLDFPRRVFLLISLTAVKAAWVSALFFVKSFGRLGYLSLVLPSSFGQIPVLDLL